MNRNSKISYNQEKTQPSSIKRQKIECRHLSLKQLFLSLYVFELLGIEKNNVDQKLFEKIHSLEIYSKMAFTKEKSRFLFELVSSWLKIGTKLPELRLANINLLDNPTVFEVPSLQEKSTNLLGKRFITLMKILIATAVSISMDKLMTFMNYKNRKTFKELYMQPLIQNGLI